MKRGIPLHPPQKKDREARREEKRTSDKNGRATCPSDGGEQRDEGQNCSERGMDGARGSAGSDQLGEENYRSTLNSISKKKQGEEKVGGGGGNKKRKKGRGKTDEEEGGRDVNGSSPWDVRGSRVPWRAAGRVHGVFRVVLPYTVVRGGTTYARRRCG